MVYTRHGVFMIYFSFYYGGNEIERKKKQPGGSDRLKGNGGEVNLNQK